MSDQRADALSKIQHKVDRLRRLEGAQAPDVVVSAGERLQPLEGVPEDVTAVFRLFRVLQGSCLRFVRPESIASAEAWQDREVDPVCPLGNPLDIGFMHLTMQGGCVCGFRSFLG
ncbi:hypothetical protein L0U85_12125 [Glycomyces sp. L485]|uniref:hypothetical protein n=1 Tax=Glycomyces sp. L485 TaxID=2909235 RepID=UPI001F4AA45B|nr:hypothetical protein [Glycomyces sp. L485]MCH7231591.1 hypothetical protein [Glycomyces sp. L485]